MPPSGAEHSFTVYNESWNTTYRQDGRCGPEFLGDDNTTRPAQCDPKSRRPCCSGVTSTCGGGPSFCSCGSNCVDYSENAAGQSLRAHLYNTPKTLGKKSLPRDSLAPFRLKNVERIIEKYLKNLQIILPLRHTFPLECILTERKFADFSDILKLLLSRNGAKERNDFSKKKKDLLSFACS